MEQQTIIHALQKSYLCENMTEKELHGLLASGYCRVAEVRKGEFIFHELDVPDHLMVLLYGTVVIAKDTLSGKKILLSRIEKTGDTFGEVYVFKHLPQYDMYAEAAEDCGILLLDVRLLQAEKAGLQTIIEKLVTNQLGMFASKAYQMNRRLRVLGSASIREKIARLLLEGQSGDSRVFGMSREDMADYLNVTRPALSREIGSMVKDGILRTEGRLLVVANQEKLEEYI